MVPTHRQTLTSHRTTDGALPSSSDERASVLTFDVKKNSHTSLNTLFGCLATSVGVVWCLLMSVVVLKCPEIPEGGVREHFRVKCIYIRRVWMRQRVFRSVNALNGAANALYWKSSDLTILKHQNTKTSLNELSKNHWVIALFEIFGSVSKKLQSTVCHDHPVSSIYTHVHMFLFSAFWAEFYMI